MKTSSRHKNLKKGPPPTKAKPAPKSTRPAKTGKTKAPKDKPNRRHAPPREESLRLVGVTVKDGQGWRLQPTSRRERGDYALFVKNREALEEGQIVVAEKTPSRQWRARDAKLVEIVGHVDSPRAVSLIAIVTHEIPLAFPPAAEAEANAAQPVTLKGRTDLRALPLVTIDGEDARDFDDAVFAEQDGDGWHAVVAIADVAHYVRAGSALDHAAFERGNSTYFPDRVVPMLPEALSNDLCSLKPHVERAALAAHLWLDKDGELTRWTFERAVIQSHARLTYEQAQAAIDGQPDSVTAPLMEKVLKPLYGVFACLLHARGKRGTLELDLPERKVRIEEGVVKSVNIRDRLDSHRLIEELMITANVAAAAQLEGKNGVCLYRIHDRPSEMKLEGLRDFLDTLGISLVPDKQLHPRFLTRILENAAGTPHAQVVNEMMLRSQSQAVYSPENIGHFGLALAKYAHFTSPIRRYADLVVHRGLIRACRLGPDGLSESEIEALEDIAEHISTTERRSAAAEREATDRFMTLFMADRVGSTFPARISGVARFGLFAQLNETGADGIIPLSALPDDYYFHDEKRQALVGRRTKKVYQLAQPVTVQITRADRLTGSLSLTIVADEESLAAKPAKSKKQDKPKRPHRSKEGRNKRTRG